MGKCSVQFSRACSGLPSGLIFGCRGEFGWLGLKEVRGGGGMCCFDFGWLGKWAGV